MAIEELFNPSEYTEKELLKLVYRELHTLRAEFDDYRKNNNAQKEMAELDKRMVALETELTLTKRVNEEKIALMKRLSEEKEKRVQRVITYVTVGLTILALLLKFI